MAKPENRSQLMAYFGAEQRNTVWSWCAVNEAEKSVYFSIWTDLFNKYGDKGRKYYTIQEPDWGIDPVTGNHQPARNDHDEKLDMVFNKGYKPYGYFIDARDKNVVPREIEATRTSFVFSLDLEKLENGTIIAYPKERINVT